MKSKFEKQTQLVRLAELNVLDDLERWLKHKDKGEDEAAYRLISDLHQVVAELVDLRKQFGLRGYHSMHTDLRRETENGRGPHDA
jgi:molecular chaperone GrpE (heat shock protein)